MLVVVRALSDCDGSTYGSGRDVRKVCSNTRGVDDIIERKLIDLRASLQKKGEGLDICQYGMDGNYNNMGKYLANAARGTENSFKYVSYASLALVNAE